jgi:protein CpxP
MKKLLFMCFFLVGISAVSRAQGMRISPEDRLAALKTELNLTDDQSAKILVIFKVSAAKRDSVSNAGGDREAIRTIMMTTIEKIKAVLTPDQRATYQKMMDEMRAKMGQGGGGGGGN